ncbi:MAG TPA: hypothetical protein VKO83_08925 [Steroidobacteraceae bacterium]|nr:hypothetical protein [Steroidobacteraceae bacterium]
MIARRHLHLLIALLLPLMVMRGMLPAGYMPVAEGGVLKMALCSDGLKLPSDNGGQDHHRLPGSSGDCLFAHAAASAPPPSIVALPAPGFTGGQSTGIPAAQQAASVIPRAQSSRGPPALQ